MDFKLYSRQIAAYGEHAMKSLTNAKVQIIDFNGSTLELCKNLILAGVSEIFINDSSRVKLSDLSYNFYVNEKDLGRLTIDAIKNKLLELNPYVSIQKNDSINLEVDVLVLTNNFHTKAIEINKLCRKNNIKFIWMNTYGLSGKVFCDFGESFYVDDVDGEQPATATLENISNNGIFNCSQPHNLYVFDNFRITELEDSELNNLTLQIDKVLDRTSFTVKDKLDWNLYTRNGRITQVKKGNVFYFKELEEFDFKINIIHDNTCFVPVNSIIGSYTAQEVIKAITHKYTPTLQIYEYDCSYLIPKKVDIKLKNDRYDELRYIFGNKIVEKMRRSSYFIVGAGAIGCEHLKNMVMMGIGSLESQIFITDMDTIEKSNLNRQFLFKNHHIGQLKSKIAAIEAMKMNHDTKIIAHENKICPDTENIYNTQFFNQINGVANALDNIKARLYVDRQCILYNKPLFESGTLGTKGNVQVVIPGLTEYYGATIDPEETGFPVCTIKNFPNSIEHTIHWARNDFEELFTKIPNSWNTYIKNPKVIDNLYGTEKGEMKHHILSLYKSYPKNYQDCIDFIINRFELNYHKKIGELLLAYPKDSLTSSNIPFWSSGKKCPSIIRYDFTNPVHLNYVKSGSIMFANMCGIKITEGNFNRESKNFTYQKVDISTDDKEEKERSKNQYLDYENKELPKDLKPVNSIVFDKDNDLHIKYITSCSNVRASNYKIPNISEFKTKLIAGKIIPAIATTTSIVSGLVCIEILKNIIGKDKIEDYHDSFMNLGLGFIAQTEPKSCEFTEINGKKYSVWDSVDIKENIIIKKLFDQASKVFGVKVDSLMYGNKCLISPMLGITKREERLNMTILDIFKTFKIPLDKGIYELQIDCLFEDEDYELPNVKFYI